VEDNGRGIDYQRVKQARSIAAGVRGTANRLTSATCADAIPPGLFDAVVKTELAGAAWGSMWCDPT